MSPKRTLAALLFTTAITAAQPSAPSPSRDPDALPQQQDAIEIGGGALVLTDPRLHLADAPACAFRNAVRPDGQPLVIAHRGASGYLPEHTLAAYAAAYFMGADVLEPDVVLTRDAVPICLHDLTLDDTTDAATKFPDRARPDGKRYAIDFTLAEIKSLAKLGREGRPRLPGQTIPTLNETLTLLAELNARTGRTVGVIPEPKDPAFHRSEGIPIEPVLLQSLTAHGYEGPNARCAVQCFDLASLEAMRKDLGSTLPMAYLIADPVDRATLERAARTCSALGPKRSLLLEKRNDRWEIARTLVEAREIGLALYPWTFANDEDEMSVFFAIGVDGLFTDFPDHGAAAREAVRHDAAPPLHAED